MKKSSSRPALGQWWRENRVSCLVLAAALVLFLAVRAIAAPEKETAIDAAEYAEYENAVITEVLSDNTFTDPAADNALLFASTVRAVAVSNGLYADFSPKPIAGEAGNGLHINISLQDSAESVSRSFMAGILCHAREMTAFLNPCEASYRRLGEKKAPRYVTWSHQNRSQLIRIPAAQGQYRRMELRSADPSVNPYLAFALIIFAGLDGVKQGLTPPEPTNLNLYTAEPAVTEHLEVLPGSLSEARRIAGESAFLRSILPEEMFR